MVDLPRATASEPGNTLIFKHHFDREDEVATKEAIKRLLKSLQEWSARNSGVREDGTQYTYPISDTVAIGEIRECFSGAKYLFNKYQEKETAQLCGGYIDYLTEQRSLETIDTIRNLQTLLDLIAEKLGIKHGFKDRTDDMQPWDRSPKQKA